MPSTAENFPRKNDRTFHQWCLSRARDEPAETPLAPARLTPNHPPPPHTPPHPPHPPTPTPPPHPPTPPTPPHPPHPPPPTPKKKKKKKTKKPPKNPNSQPTKQTNEQTTTTTTTVKHIYKTISETKSHLFQFLNKSDDSQAELLMTQLTKEFAERINLW